MTEAPESGNDLTEPYAFNLMFPTNIGPSGKEKVRRFDCLGHFLRTFCLLTFGSTFGSRLTHPSSCL